MQDAASVTIPERVVFTFYAVLYLYLYVFLFANVTSMVTDTTRSLMANLQIRYQELLKTIKAEKLPKDLIKRIQEFFQYIWMDNKGIDEKLLEDLPDTIRSDIIFNIYENAFSESKLFKDISLGELDKSAAGSFIKSGVLSRYMKGDIIVKAGSTGCKTLFLLEGELTLIGLDNEIICRISPGSWYSPQADNTDDPRINPAYLVASQVSRVLILPKNKLERLLEVYLGVKTAFYEGNKVVLERCINYIKTRGVETQRYTMEIEPAIEEEYANLSSEKISDLVKAATQANTGESWTMAELIDKANGVPQSEEITRGLLLEPHVETPKEKHRFYIRADSKWYTLIYLLHLAGIICTAIAVPLEICIKFTNADAFYFLECLCILETAFHILIRCRTPLLMPGPTLSYNFCDILREYRESGLWIDLLGLIPFNITFSAADVLDPIYIIIPLRLIRVGTLLNMMRIIQWIKLHHHKLSSTIELSSILVSYFLLWHWVSCIWLFITTFIEEDYSINWAKNLEIDQSSKMVQYLNSIHFTIKIVAGVKSSDTIAITFLERFSQYFLNRLGDFIFAVLFGLIAAFAASFSNELSESTLQSYKVEEFSKRFKLSPADRNRVKLYFGFLGNLSCTTSIPPHIKEQLPKPLVYETLYELNKHLVEPMFKQIASDAFIRKLTHNLLEEYFMPGDYIIRKGEIGDEMFFLAEGRVAIVASNKRTVLKRLYPGSYFGDVALFVNDRRICHVRAETCCYVCILKKKVIDKIKQGFREVAQKIAEIGEQKAAEFKRKDTEGSEIQEKEMEYIMSGVATRKHRSTTMLRAPLIRFTRCSPEIFSDSERKSKKTTSPMASSFGRGISLPKRAKQSKRRRSDQPRGTLVKKPRRRLSQLNAIKQLEQQLGEPKPQQRRSSGEYSIEKIEVMTEEQ